MYREFWNIFVKEYGGLRIGLTILFFTVLVALLEGINVGLLVPLLETLGSPEGAGDHWISRVVARPFDTLGIPFGLKSILLAMGVFIFAMAGLKYFRTFLVSSTGGNFVIWLRTRNMRGLLDADLSYFHRQQIGMLTDTLAHQSSQAGSCLFHATTILTNLGVVLAYLTASFLIAPILTAIALTILVLVSLSTQHHINVAKKIGTRAVSLENELSAAAVENLSGMRVIKSFLLGQFRWVDFNRKTIAVRNANFDLSMNANQITLIQETAIFSLIGLLVYLGIAVLSLDIAVVVTLLFVLYRVGPRVAGVNDSRQHLAAAMASLRNVSTAIEATSRPTVVSGETRFGGLQTAIQLQNIDFSYTGGAEVLQNVNFTIEKGMATAIVGTSGSGKSTIIDLLLRFYDPVKGRVLVDGVDLKELDLASWRTVIGVVSQDTFLFNDTIASNIAVGRPEATPERIIQAATRAYAHDFITQLPLGYDTRVGDRGLNLSGGERQRIALARAILRKPEILILDEATSALDSESEQLIQNYMREIRGSCTMVVVAHRMSTIQDSDKIVVLQDGEIVEEGDWNSLLAGAGVFANYHRLQVGG